MPSKTKVNLNWTTLGSGDNGVVALSYPLTMKELKTLGKHTDHCFYALGSNLSTAVTLDENKSTRYP